MAKWLVCWTLDWMVWSEFNETFTIVGHKCIILLIKGLKTIAPVVNCTGRSVTELIPGLSPGHCSWAKHFTLIVPLFTQVYKCGYWQIYCWGEPCDGLASHPVGSS